jgi:hypothetical protein
LDFHLLELNQVSVWQQGKRGRKACRLGAECPYKEEYQHGLEFHHDGAEGQEKRRRPTKKDKFPGGGHALGDGGDGQPSGFKSKRQRRGEATVRCDVSGGVIGKSGLSVVFIGLCASALAWAAGSSSGAGRGKRTRVFGGKGHLLGEGTVDGAEGASACPARNQSHIPP